jgi:Flp pilus assembly protein TadG
MTMRAPAPPRRHRGATVVEFAIVSSVFFTLLIGTMQMGRVLFYWSTAHEATRLGARIAAVCNLNATAITKNMVALYPQITAANVSVTYSPAGCSAATCQSVTVKINSGIAVPVAVPFIPAMGLTLPTAATTLMRESLQSTFNGTANPVCQ